MADGAASNHATAIGGRRLCAGGGPCTTQHRVLQQHHHPMQAGGYRKVLAGVADRRGWPGWRKRFSPRGASRQWHSLAVHLALPQCQVRTVPKQQGHETQHDVPTIVAATHKVLET